MMKSAAHEPTDETAPPDGAASGSSTPTADEDHRETLRDVGVEETLHVRDDDTANWVVRKIVEARGYGDRAKAFAATEEKRAEREERSLMWRFGRELEAYARQRIEAGGGRRKSVCLPAGTLGFRSGRERLVVFDEPATLAWAREHCPEAVKVSERLGLTELTKRFEATGEPPPGTAFEAGKETFGVR